MKKVLFSLVMVCVAIGSAKAQDVLLATLQKGETTQYFYGSDAFKEAMEAAENGNTITLGAGTYNAIDITKAVSIYGNGYEMRADTTSQNYSAGSVAKRRKYGISNPNSGRFCNSTGSSK